MTLIEKPTKWQTFWRYPLVWAALGILFISTTNFSHIGWNQNLVLLASGLLCWSRFWHYADKRWGKP